MKQQIIVYTDGACSGNPGPGGWAFSIRDNADTILYENSGLEPHTTNNKMELSALLNALQHLVLNTQNEKNVEIILRLDSEYALKGFFEWMDGWQARGWKTASKKPVSNRDEWQTIIKLHDTLINRGMTFKKEWVKGHSDHPGNEAVDTQACKMRDQAKQLTQTNPTHPLELNFSEAQTALMQQIADQWKNNQITTHDMLAKVMENRRFLTP